MYQCTTHDHDPSVHLSSVQHDHDPSVHVSSVQHTIMIPMCMYQCTTQDHDPNEHVSGLVAEIAQLVGRPTEKPGAVLMWVRVLYVASNFSPRVNFQR